MGKLKPETLHIASPVTFYRDKIAEIFRKYYPNLTYRIEAIEAAEMAFLLALDMERQIATEAIDKAMVNLAEKILIEHQ